MSEELTKLAKLANSAAGDSDLELKLNSSLASPKMRALHLKEEIGPLGPPGPMKMEDKSGIKMEMGGKNVQGLLKADMKVDGLGLKKEEDDSVFLRDGQMNQLNNQMSNQMNSQMMNNGPQDDKGMTMLHRQMGGYPHTPNFGLQDSQHIYTFSTLLANRAAQAVYTGQTDSILAYHRSQSCKRKFLDPEEDTGGAPNHTGNPNAGPGTPQQNNTPQSVDGTAQAANGQNGKPGSMDSGVDGARKGMDGIKGKNPDAASQGGVENVDGENASRKTPLESGTTGGGGTTTKGNKKRKRQNAASQPLQANLQGGGPGGPMQQGMPPSGPSFGPYGPGAYRPGFPPQNMPMRPPMSQGFHGQPSTTETENLDPSALWETPPGNKKTLTTTMAPSFPPDMSPMRMASPNPTLRSPSAGLILGSDPMAPPNPTGAPQPPPSQGQGPRPFMSPSHPSQSLPASPVNPYDMPNYKPPQQIDNPTPEQLRHRQERLRTLKEMQRLLFPEEQGSMSPSPGRMMSPTGMPPPQDPMGQPQGMMSPGGGPMMRPMGPSGPMMGPGGPGQHPMMHQGMGPGPGMHPRLPGQEGMRGMSPEHQRMMMQNSNIMMPPLPPDWETMTPPQREWYKLQQEFYLEKRRKIMEEQAKMHNRMPDYPPGHMGPGPMRGEPMMGGHPGGPGGFPPDMMGLNMGPPPPYPAGPGGMGGPPGPGHGMQRRASMSGGIPMGPGGPGPGGMVGGPPGPGMPNQNAPFPMSPRMPSPRTNRSSSVPGMQTGPPPPQQQPPPQQMGPVGGGPGGMNPNAMPPGPNPAGPGPVSSASSMSMGNTMSPHAPVGSPMKPAYRAPTPTSVNPAVSQPPPQNNDPLMSSMVRTPGSVGPPCIDQSPRPNQPGTPAAMDNPAAIQNVPSVNTSNTSQPGTPNSVANTAMSASVAPGTNVHGNGAQKTLSDQNVAKGPDGRFGPANSGGNGNGPPASLPNVGTPTSSSSSTAASTATDPAKPMDVQSQQRLVNFPPSQLNRDKAPNFPPRGEDLQQYASTFYQKTVNKEPPMKGPSRLQHFGSPPMNSPINPDMPTIGSPSSGIMSPGVIMSSAQPGMMPPGGMPTQSGMLPPPSHGMEGPGAQQPGMMGPSHSPGGPGMVGPGGMGGQGMPGQGMPSQGMPGQGMPSQGMPGQPMGGQPVSSMPSMMNPRMAGPQQAQMMGGPNPMGPMGPGARMQQAQQQGGMMSPQSNLMPPHGMPPQSGMMSPSMGPVDMMGPQPMTRDQRIMMQQQQQRMLSQGHPMMDGGGPPGGHMGGGPGGMMPHHPMDRAAMMQGMNNFEPGMNPGMHPNMMRFAGPRGMPNQGFMEGGMPSGPGRTNMPHPGMMGMGMGQGGPPDMGVMAMERNMGMGPNMPPTSGGQANSPLSLLQSRFSPPLLPDGKGPKQTLQYFPSNQSQGSGQGQSGNPHVNPGLASGPGPAPAQGPKQIELPFPVEMVTGGMNPGSMNPSFSRGPGAPTMGPGPRMSQMMNQEMMMQQGYGMGPGGPGPSPGPRGQVPGPNHMGYMGPRGMPGYGGMNPGPMGPGGPPYGDPNYGGMPPDPMGPGFNMPK